LPESLTSVASSPGDATPRTRQGIGAKKITFTIFFSNTKLLVAEHLPKCRKYNRNHFISDILPELEREKVRYERSEQDRTLYAHFNHSKSYHGGNIQGKSDMTGLVRALHSRYSPDLSPCDFWSFERAKGKVKDREFHTVQDIRSSRTEIWKGVIFEDVQSVFVEWKIRLNWVIGNGREDYSNSSTKNGDLLGRHSQGILSVKLFRHAIFSQERRFFMTKGGFFIQPKHLDKTLYEMILFRFEHEASWIFRTHREGIPKVMTPHPQRFPAASHRDGSDDVPSYRDPLKLSTCDTT
jgi:hypothetical protein